MDIDVTSTEAPVEAIPAQRGAACVDPAAPVAECQCRNCRTARFA